MLYDEKWRKAICKTYKYKAEGRKKTTQKDMPTNPLVHYFLNFQELKKLDSYISNKALSITMHISSSKRSV